jgi:hypothetical protein
VARNSISSCFSSGASASAAASISSSLLTPVTYHRRSNVTTTELIPWGDFPALSAIAMATADAQSRIAYPAVASVPQSFRDGGWRRRIIRLAEITKAKPTCRATVLTKAECQHANAPPRQVPGRVVSGTRITPRLPSHTIRQMRNFRGRESDLTENRSQSPPNISCPVFAPAVTL